MFTLPELPYDFAALEPAIDRKTMQIHHDGHHGTYVKNLNDLVTDKNENELEELLKTTQDQKVKNNGGGHYNHSLFWQMMTPGGSLLEGRLLEDIIAKFGSLDGFKEKFTAVALDRFGSGWVWLTHDLEIVDTPNQDNPIMNDKRVILGLDVWEHAYYLQYMNRRKDYVDAWWGVVNWRFAAKRFEQP